MKKQLFRFVFLCLALSAGLGLAACSNDDDDDASGDTRLVGKWYKERYDHTSGWLFNSNGTCQYNEWGRGGSLSFKTESKATWKTSGTKLIYHLDYGDGDYDHYEFEYSISEDGAILTLQGGDQGKSGVYTKSN